jgi:hypothetical protein
VVIFRLFSTIGFSISNVGGIYESYKLIVLIYSGVASEEIPEQSHDYICELDTIGKAIIIIIYKVT